MKHSSKSWDLFAVLHLKYEGENYFLQIRPCEHCLEAIVCPLGSLKASKTEKKKTLAFDVWTNFPTKHWSGPQGFWPEPHG